MINKILAHFPNSVTQDFPPADDSSNYYWFKENQDDTLWFGIPKTDLSASQHELLSILFHFVEEKNKSGLSGAARNWHQFLFHEGNLPLTNSDEVRFIQFQFHTKEMDHEEISEALHGFFPDYIVIWLQDSYGFLVEERKEVSETADELESISSTFESDFFIKLSFYMGKFNKPTAKLREFFTIEKQLFTQAMNHNTRTHVYTFEKIFPILLASTMPAELKAILETSVLEAFEEDRELMSTIKVFLESNSNASLAAKKLYVHRNTLQYRMDKFMEKTGVQLKDFDTAVMVYLACLYEEMR
ncbi:PucR family transcriptional regulator [Heyndrickxia sp. MSNUG]|uniref:PucR family transcriptional regulator n=1 Tax=Heyndrickxia sp. MSNUG TaxID=3136677 RepID=UPI003C2F57BA